MSRTMGHAELLGRLLHAVNGAEDTVYAPASQQQGCAYFHEEFPGCLHGHVFAALGHDRDSMGTNNEKPAPLVYPALGYALTSRAEQLVAVSQDAQDQGETWGRAIDAAVSLIGAPEVRRDRRVGDVTVWATLAHLASRYGDRPSVVDATERPCFHPYHESGSLLSHAFALWGVSAEEAERVASGGECLWSVDVLARLDWHLSARAWVVLVATEFAEVHGFSWAAVAELARQVRVNFEFREEVDR